MNRDAYDRFTGTEPTTPDTSWLYVDNTILACVASCDTKALVRHLHSLTSREESANLRAGTAVHVALEHHYKGVTPTLALTAFGNDYKEWSDNNLEPDHRLAHSNVRKILAHWIEEHPLSSLPYEVDPALVEVMATRPLTSDVMYVGKLDAIVRSRDTGRHYPLDHKSTGRIDDTFRKRHRISFQMIGYEWLTSELMSATSPGSFINAIELRTIPSSERKCQEHGVKYSECGILHCASEHIGPMQHTPEEHASWHRNAIAIARRWAFLCERFTRLQDITKVHMNGRYTGACLSCDFYEWCLYDRPLERVHDLFIEEPWRPWEQGGAS